MILGLGFKVARMVPRHSEMEASKDPKAGNIRMWQTGMETEVCAIPGCQTRTERVLQGPGWPRGAHSPASAIFSYKSFRKSTSNLFLQNPGKLPNERHHGPGERAEARSSQSDKSRLCSGLRSSVTGRPLPTTGLAELAEPLRRLPCKDGTGNYP